MTPPDSGGRTEGEADGPVGPATGATSPPDDAGSTRVSAHAPSQTRALRGSVRKWREWMPRVLFEAALIVFSVLFALALDEWMQERQLREQTALALEGVRVELRENRAAVGRAHMKHAAVHDSLTVYMERDEPPPPRIYYGGMFSPARVLATAWLSARENGAADRIPYDLRLSLARVYDQQARYQELGDAIVQSIYADQMQRSGEAVYRDGYKNFAVLTRDFADREYLLGEAYDSVLAVLNRVSQ